MFRFVFSFLLLSFSLLVAGNFQTAWAAAPKVYVEKYANSRFGLTFDHLVPDSAPLICHPNLAYALELQTQIQYPIRSCARDHVIMDQPLPDGTYFLRVTLMDSGNLFSIYESQKPFTIVNGQYNFTRDTYGADYAFPQEFGFRFVADSFDGSTAMWSDPEIMCSNGSFLLDVNSNPLYPVFCPDGHSAVIDWGSGPRYLPEGDYALSLLNGDRYLSNFFHLPSLPNPNPRIHGYLNAFINESQTYQQTVTFIDPDSTSWQARIDYGDGVIQSLALKQKSFILNHSYKDNGVYKITIALTDSQGNKGTRTVTVKVNNLNPELQPISVPSQPKASNTAITFSAKFTDLGTLDSHTSIWDWGDGTTGSGSSKEANGSGTVTGMHSYKTPGFYLIKVKLLDKDNGEASIEAETFVTVFAPNSGPISGAGKYISPTNALNANPASTGPASFDFQLRYQGSNLIGKPITFSFPNGTISFTSTNFEWLVLQGSKAFFRASGKLNGVPGYAIAVAIQDPGPGKPGLIRVQLFNPAGAMIYNSKPRSNFFSDPTTPINAGSIEFQLSKSPSCKQS